MKSGDTPAMPSGVLQDGHNCGNYPLNTGLTKREQFAMAAMQGLCANSIAGPHHIGKRLVIEAVEMADALLAELDRTK